LKNTFFPTDVAIYQELEKDPSFRWKFEEACNSAIETDRKCGMARKSDDGEHVLLR
jgi:hypothetical protein